MKKSLYALLMIFGCIAYCFAEGDFDGNDAIIVQDPGAKSPMDTYDAITIVSWARADPSTLGGADGGPDNQIILNKDEYVGNYRTSVGYEIAIGDNHGTVDNAGYFTYYLPGISEGSNGNLPEAGSGWKTGSKDPVFKDGEWHMVAVTYDETSCRLLTYVDGVLQKNVSAYGYMGSNGGSIMIAARGKDSSPYSFLKNGSVGDVKIFSRSLSPEEIQALNNSPDALIGDVLDMPLLYNATDRSGNNYTITEYGDPQYNGHRPYVRVANAPVRTPIPLFALVLSILVIPFIVSKSLSAKF